MSHIQHDEKETVNAAIQSTSKVFCHLLAEGSMVLSASTSGSKEKYRQWLQARYKDADRCLCNVVGTFASVPVLQVGCELLDGPGELIVEKLPGDFGMHEICEQLNIAVDWSLPIEVKS